MMTTCRSCRWSLGELSDSGEPVLVCQPFGNEKLQKVCLEPCCAYQREVGADEPD